MEIIEKYFKLRENNSDLKTEFFAGLTTFMTMAYIIIVNPSILSSGAGMPYDDVFFATIIGSVIAMLIMGLWANYPIALAPGMGLNAYFAYTICKTMGYSWQTALGAVFISGVLFLILTFLKIRQLIVYAIPNSIKIATAIGIGLFIAFIGMKNVGIIVSQKETFVTLGNVCTYKAIFTLVGILIIAALYAKKVKGALLWGILINWFLGLILGYVKYKGIFSLPHFPQKTFLAMDLKTVLNLNFLTIVFSFFFVDFFDTTGTLVGIAEQAGFIKENGDFPRVEKAMTADAVGTITGAILGTSTITSYIESSSGVAVGGRTGLTVIFTAMFFLLSLFFSPLAASIPDFATSPVLIIIGIFMLKQIKKINFEDMSEAIPAFVVMLSIPLTYSIATGIALGFILYPLTKLVSGKAKDVHWLVWILCLLFIARFIFLEKF